MKKFRLKRFIIVFFIFMVIQFLVGLADISFYQNNNELSSISNMLMTVFSLPISLIHRGLPFYINEALPIKVLFWVINLLIQTAIILGGASLIRSVREKMKH